jgi:hypothetical protein
MIIRDFEIPMSPPIRGKEIETSYGTLRVVIHKELENEHKEAADHTPIRKNAEGSKDGKIQ